MCCGVCSMCCCSFSGCCSFVFFFKQKTAYEMRISDWSSDVCSSDLDGFAIAAALPRDRLRRAFWAGIRILMFGHAVSRAFSRIVQILDRKSVVWGKSVSVRVDLGGRRIIKKKKIKYMPKYSSIIFEPNNKRTTTRDNVKLNED